MEKKILRFLKGPKKGETYELKSGLVSQYKIERKDAIQRVIQAMTVGKDVLALFPDVLKNIATYDLEQKKLVYLYLMNYAKLNPELCILAVNTFVQDTEDPNPLIRALAIRTMGCVRVDKMVDYMEIPLRRTLLDDNPYVRKTAAVCVAKLFDLDPHMCVEHGFLADLQRLLADPNPMVVANALSALLEIRDMNRDPQLRVLRVDKDTVAVLLACLNECTEWGRVTILTCLCDYAAAGAEAQHIVERCVPQLQHANPAVVLAAVKVVLHHGAAHPPAQRDALWKKLSAPLVSLALLPIPEAQYVGLKNIRIILERHPQVLTRELRVFFIKYSDPLYLKLEKLEILVRLAAEANAALLLGELKEYAMEIEPMLVARAVQCMGAVAIKLAAFAVPALSALIHLLDHRGGDVLLNLCVPVFASVLRRYPRRNDLVTLVVPVVLRLAPELSDPPALAAYVFLLGHYPSYFSALPEQLRPLVDSFLDAEPPLQLNILAAVVRICVAVPDAGCSALLQAVLEKATTDCDNPDVRDKAYLYWRLLSLSAPDAQRAVILAPLPPIDSVIASFSPAVLDALMHELSTLSSVYLKPAATFVDPAAAPKARRSSRAIDDLTSLAKQEIIANANNENLLDLDDDDTPLGSSASALDDLNDLFAVPPVSAEQKQPSADILSLFDSPAAPNSSSPLPSTHHASTSHSSPPHSSATHNPVSGLEALEISATKPAPLSDDLLDLL